MTYEVDDMCCANCGGIDVYIREDEQGAYTICTECAYSEPYDPEYADEDEDEDENEVDQDS